MPITKGKGEKGFRGDILYHRRRMLGMNLLDIAKAIGISFNAVHQWENEKCAPNPKSLFKLAKVLKVKPDYFYQKDVARPVQSTTA